MSNMNCISRICMNISFDGRAYLAKTLQNIVFLKSIILLNLTLLIDYSFPYNINGSVFKLVVYSMCIYKLN